MKPCRFPAACPFEARTTVRIFGVGDRDVCPAHLAWMREAGMSYREVEPNAYVPEWRKRLTARDLTGRVLA